MPFLAEEHVPIPTQDILSYYFDEPQYDHDKPIFIDAFDTSQHYTANQAKSTIRKLTAGFKAVGLTKGDCVCIVSFNNIHYPVVANGIAGFGGVYTGTNPAYTVYELVHHLKASKSECLIVEPELLKNAVAAAKEVCLPKERVFIFDEQGRDGFRSWRSLLEHGESDWIRFDDLETAKNTTLARLFSSGTTGLPKAASLSHRNFIAEYRLFTEWPGTTWQRKRIVVLPMFHAATAPLIHFGALRCGDECYIAKRFDLEIYFQIVEKHQITEGAFVPPMINAIINSPLAQKYSLKSLRIAHAGAAPVDKYSQARLKKLLAPDCQLAQIWGMTETVAVAFFTPYHKGSEDTGSVGTPLPNIDAKLVDDDGNDITADDVRGELCVRGPLVFQGYFQNPEPNARDFDADGYFHTGDILYRDSKSKLWYIVDRKKELIKVRGFQVSPSEIEAVLLTQPKVLDVAVIGVPATSIARDAGKGSGELPRVYLVKQPNVELLESEVKSYVSEKLAKYKQVDGGVVFIEALPKSMSGKILKRVLREQAQAELKDKAKL